MKKTASLLIVLVLQQLLSRTLAQLANPGSVDPSFASDGPPVAEGFTPVKAIAAMANGQILAVGDFLQWGSAERNRIVRLNADGSVDSAFTPGLGVGGGTVFSTPTGSYTSTTLECLALLPTGKILIGGSFTEVNGFTSRGVARLQSDGTLDTEFSADATGGPLRFNQIGGDSAAVSAIAVQPDGKILIGGIFTAVDGQARNRIARLNENGSVDVTFDVGSGVSSTPYQGVDTSRVEALVVQSDGKVVVAGRFTQCQGQSRSGIVRLNSNGAIDLSFLNTGVAGGSAVVSSLLRQEDGRVILGGDFSAVNGLVRKGVARLNLDGSVDETFAAGPVVNGAVEALAFDGVGRILLAGAFTSVSNMRRSELARLNSDGSLDLSFDPGSGPAAPPNPLTPSVNVPPVLNAISVEADGRIVVGGWFSSFSGTARQNLARLLGGGSDSPRGVALYLSPQDQSINAGQTFSFKAGATGFPAPSYQWQFNGTDLPGQTDPFLTLTNTRTVSAGEYRVVVANSLGTLTSPSAWLTVHAPATDAGSVDLSFDFENAAAPSGDPRIRAILVQPDARILIRGYFEQIGALPSPGLARLLPDGSLDPTFTPSTEYIFTSEGPLGQQPDGRILVANAYPPALAASQRGLARLNQDGSRDASFDLGQGFEPNGQIAFNGLYIQPDQKILVVGNFTSVQGVSRNGVARLNSNGSLDLSFDAGEITSSDPTRPAFLFTSLLQPDGRLLIAGSFSAVQGVARPGLARLTANGRVDPSFVPSPLPNGPSFFQTQPTTGKILIAGQTASFSSYYLTRLNPDGTPDSSFQSRTNIEPGNVWAMAVQPDGRILIGGNFGVSASGGWQSALRRFNADGELDSSFQSGISPGFVESLAIQSDGRILAGGDFGQVNGAPRSGLARLSSESTNPEFQIVNPTRVAQSFQLTLPATLAQKEYILEYTDSLQSPVWLPYQSTTTGDGFVKTFLDSTATPSQRYYRIRSQ